MDGVAEAVRRQVSRARPDAGRHGSHEGQGQRPQRAAEFPDLKLLVGIWSYNAPAIVDVVEETGKRKELKIVTFDAEKLAIDQMGDGMIDAMVVQNPYEIGYQGDAAAQGDGPGRQSHRGRDVSASREPKMAICTTPV